VDGCFGVLFDAVAMVDIQQMPEFKIGEIAIHILTGDYVMVLGELWSNHNHFGAIPYLKGYSVRFRSDKEVREVSPVELVKRKIEDDE